MPGHPVPNLGVTAGTGISFWEVITRLAEFCELGSALVWALTLALALVRDVTLCCCGDRMLDEKPSGSSVALCSIYLGFSRAAPNSASREERKGQLLPQAWMLLTSAPWLAPPRRGLGVSASWPWPTRQPALLPALPFLEEQSLAWPKLVQPAGLH